MASYDTAFHAFADIRASTPRSHHGARIECFESGAGPALLLLPGFCLATVFRNQFRSLSAHHRVISLNYPGAGASDPDDACTSAEELSDVLASVIDALELAESPHVLGWSMGTFFATHLAHRHPDRVRSLILANGTAVWNPRAGVRGEGVTATTSITALLAQEFAQQMAARRSEWPGFGYQHLQDADGLRRMRETYDTSVDLRAALRQIAVPVTVISGGRDGVCPPPTGALMASHPPGAAHLSYPEMGHFGPLFFERDFDAAILQHLARCRDSTAAKQRRRVPGARPDAPIDTSGAVPT